MPWDVVYKPIKSSEKDWAIRKKVNGHYRIVGRSTSRKKALASKRARYASKNKG